jgi:hypothetical protein
MNCSSVHAKLAGYMDGTIAGATQAQERIQLRKHLDECTGCREELERFRKLSTLLSRMPRSVPPVNLATRIRVAAAQSTAAPDAPTRWRRVRNRAEILFDNVFRPITLPATGGFVSAILVFVVVLQLIVPGITVRAVQNDVPLNILRPAELISLSDYPDSWASDQHDAELALPHGLLLDVTVDAHGQMVGYEILSGPRSVDLRHQLDQMLLFSRFRPMLSFGRPTSGGHVILSFSAVHVRG